MALNGVRALLFDVFGTVVDWRSGVAREATPFLRRRGAESVDPLAFADAWRASYQPAMEQVRSGRRRFTPLDHLADDRHGDRDPHHGGRHRPPRDCIRRHAHVDYRPWLQQRHGDVDGSRLPLAPTGPAPEDV